MLLGPWVPRRWCAPAQGRRHRCACQVRSPSHAQGCEGQRERHRAAGAELEQRHPTRVKWWEHLAVERHPALRENEAVACSMHQLRRSWMTSNPCMTSTCCFRNLFFCRITVQWAGAPAVVSHRAVVSHSRRANPCHDPRRPRISPLTAVATFAPAYIRSGLCTLSSPSARPVRHAFCTCRSARLNLCAGRSAAACAESALSLHRPQRCGLRREQCCGLCRDAGVGFRYANAAPGPAQQTTELVLGLQMMRTDCVRVRPECR
jgi:hypothetical protein